jgi:hypothetical protein
MRPISFSLVVDNFGVKYVGKENAQHLLDTVREYYKCACEWKGERYWRLTTKWDYEGKKVHVLMPGYVTKALTRFWHPPPVKIQNQPYPHTKPNYRAKTQHSTAEDTSPPSTRRGRNLSKKCAEFSFSLHTESTAAYFPHSAPQRPNRQTQWNKRWHYVSNFWITWHHGMKQYSPTK